MGLFPAQPAVNLRKLCLLTGTVCSWSSGMEHPYRLRGTVFPISPGHEGALSPVICFKKINFPPLKAYILQFMTT